MKLSKLLLAILLLSAPSFMVAMNNDGKEEDLSNEDENVQDYAIPALEEIEEQESSDWTMPSLLSCFVNEHHISNNKEQELKDVEKLVNFINQLHKMPSWEGITTTDNIQRTLLFITIMGYDDVDDFITVFTENVERREALTLVIKEFLSQKFASSNNLLSFISKNILKIAKNKTAAVMFIFTLDVFKK